MLPYIVIEDSSEAFEEAVEELRGADWRIASGWNPPRGARKMVCVGRVESAEDAAAALLAVVSGAGVVIEARAEREIIDRLCDDLRRFGRIDHRTASRRGRLRLDPDEVALLRLLLDGRTLGDAAAELGLSRRTADRRLSAARRRLGVATTAEALMLAARRRII